MATSLAGHVDQVADCAITGWVADLANPARLERVVCSDGAGRSVAFTAWHVREDVCRFFGNSGRFGFVVPTNSLRGLSSPVTIRDRLGAVLPGGEAITLPSRVGADQPRTTFIFLHIPKTAGTSVRHALIDDLLPSERLFIYPPPFGLLIEEFAALPAAQLQAARLVVGHAHFGLHRFLDGPARYLTFLREPTARSMSQTAHHFRAGTRFHVDGRDETLQRVVNEALDEQFDNLMVRVIAGLPRQLVPLGAIGPEHLDAALRNIEARFDFVGSVETLQEDLPRLAAVLGRPVATPRRENVNEDPNWLERSSLDIDWDRVAERNRFDRKLWEQARL